MSDKNINITMSVDDAEMIRTFQRQQKELMKTQNRLMRMSTAARSAGRDSNKMVKDSTEGLTDFRTGVLGIGTALTGMMTIVGVIKNEYEEMRRKQDLTRAAALGFAPAFRKANIAFNPDDTVKRTELKGEFERIAKKTRTTETNVALVAVNAFSAKGDKTNREALESIEASLLLTPNDVGAAADFSGRILDIQKKSSNKIDSMAAAGFLQNLQSNSRVARLPDVGTNGVDAIMGLVNNGDSIEEAAEFFAFFSQQLGDATGSISKTAVKNFAERMKKFVPSTEGKDKRGEFNVPQTQIDQFEKATSTKERKEVLQASPELRRSFFSNVTFDVSASGLITEFLNGNKLIEKGYEAAQKGINAPNMEQKVLFEQVIKDLDSVETQNILTAEQQTDQNLNSFHLNNGLAQVNSSVRNNVKKVYDEVDAAGDDWATYFKSYFVDIVGQIREDDDWKTALSNLESYSIDQIAYGSKTDHSKIDTLLRQIDIINQTVEDGLGGSVGENGFPTVFLEHADVPESETELKRLYKRLITSTTRGRFDTYSYLREADEKYRENRAHGIEGKTNAVREVVDQLKRDFSHSFRDEKDAPFYKFMERQTAALEKLLVQMERNQAKPQEVKVVEDKTKMPEKQSRKTPVGKVLSK